MNINSQIVNWQEPCSTEESCFRWGFDIPVVFFPNMQSHRLSSILWVNCMNMHAARKSLCQVCHKWSECADCSSCRRGFTVSRVRWELLENCRFPLSLLASLQYGLEPMISNLVHGLVRGFRPFLKWPWKKCTFLLALFPSLRILYKNTCLKPLCWHPTVAEWSTRS